MRRRVVNQQNSMPPVAHCNSTVAASRLITFANGNAVAWRRHGLPPPPPVDRRSSRSHPSPSSSLAAIALAGCVTGPRPSFDADEPAQQATGDPAIDAVLERLDRVGLEQFTADYTILTRLGGKESTATRRAGRQQPAFDHDQRRPVPRRHRDGDRPAT